MLIIKFMKKDGYIRLKIQALAYIMSLIILVSPLFTLNRNKKDFPHLLTPVNASSNIDSDNIRSYNELALEIEGMYDIDFSNMVIPLLTNDKCKLEYGIDRDDSKVIYNEATRILNIIISNSSRYSLDNKDFVSIGINDLNDINGIDKILINDTIKTYIKELLKRGINKDICIISNLKIVLSYDKNTPSEVKFKYFNDKELLVIYPDNIRKCAKDTGKYFFEVLEEELMIILNEIRQNACCHQDSNNVFHNEALREASVETELYNYSFIDSINNPNVRYEREILLLGLFNENTSYDMYLRSIFINDIRLFYDFCCITDGNEIERLNKILYSIDNGYSDNYKVDLFSMVINNMINYTSSHKDFKLRDNLVIYSIIENILSSNNEDINKLKDIYFNYLCNHYRIDIESINNTLNSDKVKYSVKALIDFCNKNIDYDLDMSYTEYSSTLVERFPILRYILSSYSLEDIDVNKRMLTP